jgi:hypothetical protein
MRTAIAPFMIVLLGFWLAGCATPGRTYDDNKIAMIKTDVTTAAELLQWFGPASSRTVGPDGTVELTWRFAPPAGGRTGSLATLAVRLGADGKVTRYSAANGRK